MSLICHGFISQMICLDDKNVVVWRTYADNNPSNILINHPHKSHTSVQASVRKPTQTSLASCDWH